MGETQARRLCPDAVVMPPDMAKYRVASQQIRRIMGEDNHVCEEFQKVAAQVDGEQLFGRQEERIGWLEEEYAKVMTGRDSR